MIPRASVSRIPAPAGRLLPAFDATSGPMPRLFLLLHSAPCGNGDLFTRRDQLCSLFSDGNLSQLAKVLIRDGCISGSFGSVSCAIQGIETVWGKFENSLVLGERFLRAIVKCEQFREHLSGWNYGSGSDRVLVHTLFQLRRRLHQRDRVGSLAIFLRDPARHFPPLNFYLIRPIDVLAGGRIAQRS